MTQTTGGGSAWRRAITIAAATGTGLLALPPCPATAGTLTVGGTAGSGTLRLNGTTFAVADALAVSSVGKIVTDVGSVSCGLDLPDDPEFSFTLDGVIEINFLELPATGSDPHYGLRWEGDRQATLENLILDGKIVTDYSALLPQEEAEGEGENGGENGGEMFTTDVYYDGTYTYVILIADVSAVSEYAFSYELTEPVYAGVDTVVLVTFANVEPAGDLGYDAVRISFDAAGPGDVTFTLDAYTAVNSGYLGSEVGFELPAVYSSTADWTLNFSEAGTYTVTFRCYEIGDEANPFAEDSVVVEVELTPIYGDASRDGTVDLLDLVFVRNRLFAEDLDEGDNRQADINGDNQVDLEDLIEVRNNLGARRE